MEGDAVVNVEPRGENDRGRYRGPDGLEDVAGEARAVLEAAAVGAGAVASAEQFIQQVAVALLHVDEVEPDLDRELRRRDVVIDEPLQFVVGKRAAVSAAAL